MSSHFQDSVLSSWVRRINIIYPSPNVFTLLKKQKGIKGFVHPFNSFQSQGKMYSGEKNKFDHFAVKTPLEPCILQRQWLCYRREFIQAAFFHHPYDNVSHSVGSGASDPAPAQNVPHGDLSLWCFRATLILPVTQLLQDSLGSYTGKPSVSLKSRPPPSPPAYFH